MPNPENKVKFGLSNVYYAVQTVGSNGKITFGAPKRYPGAVSLSLDAQGDQSKFYAENVAYFVSTANDGYSGTLETALMPDSFAVEVLHESLDETDKVLVENATAESAAFALLFQFEGDKHGTRHVLYNCTASRPTVASKTTSNNKEPSTTTLNLNAAPMADGLVKAKTTADTPTETYNGWFNAVWQPSAAEA